MLTPLNIFDLQDYIIDYLDINSMFNFISSCKNTRSYTYTKRYNYMLIIKIINYFTSLKKINLRRQIAFNKETRLILFNIYIKFKNYQNISLSNILYEIPETNTNNLFEEIISHCYFNRKKECDFNGLKADDLTHLLMFKSYNYLKLITEHIFIEPEILSLAIQFKLNKLNENSDAIKLLFNYMLFKHFFKNDKYNQIEDIITKIICNVIKNKNSTTKSKMDILKTIYLKQQYYKFTIYYQQILSINDNLLDFIDFIYEKQIEQNLYRKSKNLDIQHIIIPKEKIFYLMTHKQYKILYKVIDLFLQENINMNIYFNIILDHFNIYDEDCKTLTKLKVLTTENKNKLIMKYV